MKRCWIGIGFLLAFLGLGLICGYLLGRFGEELARETEQAAYLAETDRAAAEALLLQVRQKWEKTGFLLRVLSDHSPIDRAETLFLLTKHAPDPGTFRLTALELSQVLRELGQSQLPKWENIL